MAPPGNGPASRRGGAIWAASREWVMFNGVDCLSLMVLGGVTFAIYHSDVPLMRTFPITFSGSGDVVYPDWAYPFRGWIMPSWCSGVVAIGGPIVVYLAAQVRLKSLSDASCAVLGSITAVVLASFFQVVLKQLVGGFRPYFLDVCMPDVNRVMANRSGLNRVGFHGLMFTTEVCTQPDAGKLKTAITSFPSGHTSATCAGFGFVFFWLNAKLKVWADYRPAFWKLFLTLLPVLLCAIISCLLTVDAAHNWYDVVGGAVIGFTMAMASYRTSYAALWDWRFNHVPLRQKEAFSYAPGGEDTALTLTQKAGWGGTRAWLPHHVDSAATSTAFVADPANEP